MSSIRRDPNAVRPPRKLRPYSWLELTGTWLALAFAIAAFFLDSIALVFAAGLTAAFSAALTVARIVFEEIEPPRGS